jgi:hypothetical protein
MSVVDPEDVQIVERWLDCQLDKGMFSDEFAVTYPPHGQAQKSVFVSAAAVRGQAGQRGKVRVRVVRRGTGFMAILPSCSRDIVQISELDVSDE